MSAERTPARTAVVLVVDDSPQNLHLLGATLGEYPEFDLCFATGGKEALEAAQSVPPDLVLLDVNMPGMDGFEVCRVLRASERAASTPVIFLTAQGDTDRIVQGFGVGGNDYVVKPFAPQELLARVRVQLELHWSRMELKRLNEELRFLSNTDGLLRIANRRHFDEILSQEWNRATRGRTSLSLLIVDVDHFKLFNDHHGHLEGDECLKRVAGVLTGCVRRATDLVARYGGEEFGVILPETVPENACRVAEGIHRALADIAFPHGASPVSPFVTVSIGVASAVPAPESHSETLLQGADDALYAAKQGGRNRTQLA